MDYANVIPIDADVARLLERRRTRFRWLVCAVASVWLAVLVPAILFTPLPPIGAFVVLAVLVVLAEHRFVVFGDETSMSASIIVVIASVFVFADSSPLVGPMLIASLGGLYFPLLRARAFAKVLFNGTCVSLAATGAVAAAAVVGRGSSPLHVIAAVTITLFSFWIVNNLIVAGHQATLCGEPLGRSARTLLTCDTEILLWVAAGSLGVCAVGTSLLAETAVVVVVVACWTAAVGIQPRWSLEAGVDDTRRRDALVVWFGAISAATLLGTLDSVSVALAISAALVLPHQVAHPKRIISIGLPICAILTASSGPTASLALAGVCAFALTRCWKSPWTWVHCVGLGVTSWVSLLWLIPAGAISATSGLAVAASVVVPMTFAFVIFAIRTSVASTRGDRFSALGLLVPTKVESAFVAASVATALAYCRSPALSIAVGTSAFALRSFPIVRAPRIWVRAFR